MSRIILILLLTGLYSCDPIKKLYVKYGEVKPVLALQKDSVIRIYFDREGTIYPDVLIPANGLEKSNGSLDQFYISQPTVFQQAALQHGLAANATADDLQLRLIEQTIAGISSSIQGKQAVFLIHGYNKHPLLPAIHSGFEVYKTVRDSIAAAYPQQKMQFIELYWDGCSKMNGKKWKQTFNSFKVWKRAQPASQNVGLEFRRILNGLSQDNMVIISHSLGASVVTSALFNVDKFAKGATRNRILSTSKDTIHYKTPANLYRVGMLAPAIPGTNTFDEFGDRTPASPYDSSNYYFVVGFNRHDQTLRKYIGLEKKFGATTLGCRLDDLDSVKRMLNTDSKIIIDHADFSWLSNGQKQKSHAFVNYIRNEVPMKEFLRKLF